ncbi:MAG TPA: sulfatase-like hydrolase/transferase, partial [Lacipirellulaceae bacterium]|nr:sulfatase-like hydrolase/transferase [Lacipirellulaceae bacterium]
MRPALFAAAALLAGALGSSAVEAQTSRPNIVVILADDAGYADFAFSRAISGGTSQFQSPNIDALAQQSVVARQGYVASPLCGPSRAGLLTGQYPQRFGIEENLGNDASQRFGFDGTERLLSHRLKELGYATGMTGKWHGGFVPGVNRPNDMGFDHFFGFLSGSRQYYADVNPANLMYRNQVNVESTWRSQGDASQYDPVRGRYVTDAFGEESASFITQHAAGGNPFFLYASFTAPHTPLTAKQADLDRFSHIANAQDRTLAAMVYSLDRAVGRIVDALTASGAMDNTIIAFLNDNGGTANSNNGVFRDYKGKTHEGGIRVPFFLKMPGVAPGTYEQPISTMDLVPTLLAAAGGAVSMAETDGVNLLPYFNGNSTAAPHETLFWRNR